MITQIKPLPPPGGGDKKPPLTIHPELQVKLQLSRLTDTQFSSKFSTIIEFKRRPESDSPQLFTHIHSDTQPRPSHPLPADCPQPQTLQGRRTSRRKARLSSYQLYKEQQRGLKEAHGTKVSEWKVKYMTMRNDRERTNRSSITSSPPGKQLHQRAMVLPAAPLQDMIALRPISEGKFRSTFIKTGEGKRKMVDNNVYLRKLKTKIEFYSLSTIITEREQAHKAANPSQLRISPGQPRKNTEKEFRPSVKSSKARFKGRNRENDVPCRPWSGYKEDFTSQLSNYL